MGNDTATDINFEFIEIGDLYRLKATHLPTGKIANCNGKSKHKLKLAAIELIEFLIIGKF